MLRKTKTQRTVKKKTNEPALVLTGEQELRRTLIYMQGKAVWLTGNTLELLCELISAAASDSPAVTAQWSTVHRLRKAIEHGVSRPGAGKDLIITAGSRYRLRIDPSDIALHPTFPALAETGALSRQEIENLTDKLPVLRRSHTVASGIAHSAATASER